MGRRKDVRMRGKGFGSELIKRILMEGAPLVGKLLEEPTKELGSYLGRKLKRFTGGGTKLAGEGYKLAGEQAGGCCSSCTSGRGIYLAGEKPRSKKKVLPRNID
jgi:hypothetical protein